REQGRQRQRQCGSVWPSHATLQSCIRQQPPTLRNPCGKAWVPKSVCCKNTPAIISVMCVHAHPGAAPKRSAAPVCQQRDVRLIQGSYGPRSPFGKQPVELIGEHLTLALTQRGRAARIDAAAAQLIQEIADRQALANVLARIQLATGIQRKPAFLDY